MNYIHNRKYWLFLIIMLFVSIELVAAQQKDSDSLKVLSDSLLLGNDSQSIQQEANITSKDSDTPQKIVLTKRNVSYDSYIWGAVSMMAFITIILTSVQNWNPE